jgi:hypothetical protein
MGLVVDSYRFAAAAFSPLDLPNLFAWWDSSDTSSYTNSGTPNYSVDDWDDQTGTFRAVSQTTNPQGTGASVALNGLDTIYWTNDPMVSDGSVSDWSFLHKSGEYVIFLVLKRETTGFDAALGNIGPSLYNGPYMDVLGYQSNSFRHLIQVNGSTFPVSNVITMSINAYHIVAIRSDAGNATAAERSRIWLDGGTPFKNNTGTATPSTADSGLLSLGDRGDNLGWDGHINDILICNGDLDIADINDAGDWFADKWGLTWTTASM